MFCDEAQVTFIAGKGGDGLVTFRREKYIPKGGPSGGDGGTGGNIVLCSSYNLHTLGDFLREKTFKAEDGHSGQRSRKHGANGTDLVLLVPVGTILSEAETGDILFDFTLPDEQFVIVRGGRGGYGNAHFTSSVRQLPRFAELGDRGEVRSCRLELKLIADAGIIGLPSVGKSTLINRVSRAKSRVAAYPFTTLVPHLGVVDLRQFGGESGESFVIADMPGLIEGASQGKGLGDEFLKHIARTRVLVHVMDVTRDDLLSDFQVIQSELAAFDADLLGKEQIMVFNKIDLVGPTILKAKMKKFISTFSLHDHIFPISAATGVGLKELLFVVWKKVKTIKPVEKIVSEEVRKYYPIDEDERLFTITRVDQHTFRVQGKRIEQIVRMSDLSNEQALSRIYHVLQKRGILKALSHEGAKEGDVILIAQGKFDFYK